MSARWPNIVSLTRTTLRMSEELTIVAACAASIAASLIVLPNAQGAMGGGLAVLMIMIAVVDARHFIIPDELTVAALAVGFLHAAMLDSGAIMEMLVTAAMRGALLAVAFFVLLIGYRHLRGREGMGLGDVKLAGVAGVWLDWRMIPIAIEMAALAALAVYSVRIFQKRRTFRAASRLPFGLFFAPAIWLAWLFGVVF